MPYEEDDDKLGNQKAKPRYEISSNPIFDKLSTHLNKKEGTYADSSYWSDSQVKPYNPDDLVQKNFDYSTYEEMAKDDQVSVCLQLKRDLVLANGFDILVDSEDQFELDIKEDLEKSLREYPEIELMESLEEVVSAYDYGFSISEKVFEIKEDGKACLKFLKTRHPVTWLLHTDTQGNITRYEQRGPEGSIDLQAENLIHYKVNNRFGNPYGRSDLRSAWEAWFIKKEIIKYYAIFLEKAASPTPVARYDKNLPQAAVDDIFLAIKKLQTKTALAIPKDIELEFLESGNQGEVYIKGINLFNMFIGRALLVPDLLGFQGSETSGGSYSLGKDQMNVFFRHINRRRTQIEDIVNKHIIKPLVYYNYGYLENCPRFKLKPMNDEEAVELSKLWLEAVKGHVYKPNEEEINHFRGLCKFPEGDVEFEEEPMPITGQVEELPPGEEVSDSEADSAEVKEKEPEDSEEEKPKENKKTILTRVYDNPPGSYDKKVNYAAIENILDKASLSIMKEASPIIENIYQDISSQIIKKRIIQAQSMEKFDSIKVKFTPKLKSLLKKYFLDLHASSKLMAQSELLNGNRQFAAPLPDEEFLKFLEQELDQFIYGDYEYTVLKNTKIALINAIKDGKPLAEVVGVLSNEGEELSKVQMERFARTKFTEVMNKARLEFFNSSGIVAGYQYSAVMDDRTSEICSGLHGAKFEAGDEPVPPLHFNCRSLLIPITKYEEFKADEKIGDQDIDKFIEENKGTGFPVK